MKKPAYLMAFALLLTANASTSHADDFAEKARASFGPVVRQYDLPGLVVGVTRNGRHQFYAVGLASRADRRRVTEDTIFELGSISKIFNATLAALAEVRGRIDLGDTVAHHICADACAIGDRLTLMDLATHHSGGLPLQVPQGVSDIGGVTIWLKGWRPPQPGTRSYSNISIGLLGNIIGQAMGSSYRVAAQDTLFPAFGLRHTWIDVPRQDMPQYAFGYDRKTNAPIRMSPGVLDAEAYGVKSTARDMLRVLDVELGVATVSDDVRKAIERTHEGQYKTKFFTQDMIWEQYPWPVPLQTMLSGNGYDFIMNPQPVERISPPLPAQKDVILNKTGSTNGFGAYIAMLPGKRLGIVVLANRNYPNEARVEASYSLINALLAD